jgi:hypothetical protein
MDILNYISWIKSGKLVPAVDPTKTLIPFAVKDGKRDDKFVSVTMTVEEFISQITTGVYTDLIPSLDDTYSLGSSTNRWKELYLGEGTLYITDTVTGLDAALTVTNGTLFVNGVSLMSVAGLEFADNTTQTTAFDPTPTTFNPQFTDAGGLLAGVTATGSYTLIGNICYFRVSVDFSGCTNFGTTQYQITLPFSSIATMRQANGTLHQPALSAQYHIAGITDTDTAADDILLLYYSGSTTDLAWKNTTPVGATTVTSHFDISGVYEIA